MIFACCQKYARLWIYDADTYIRKYECIVNGVIRSITFVDSEILVILVDTIDHSVDDCNNYKLVFYNYNIDIIVNIKSGIPYELIQPKIKISPDCRYLILSGYNDIIIYTYDSENITETNHIVYDNVIYDFDITADNCILINCGNAITKYNILKKTEEPILQIVIDIPDPYWHWSPIVILPDFTRFAYRVNNILTISDFTNLSNITIPFSIADIKFSYLNPNIVAISVYSTISNSTSLQIWDIVTSICLHTLFDTLNTILDVSNFTFELNTDNILVLFFDGTIKIFNTLSGDEILTIFGFGNNDATVIEFQNNEMVVLW